MDTFNEVDQDDPKASLIYELEFYKKALKTKPFDREKAFEKISDFKKRVLIASIPFARGQKIFTTLDQDNQKISKQEGKVLEADQQCKTVRQEEKALKKELKALSVSDPEYKTIQGKINIVIGNRIDKEQSFDKEEKKFNNLNKKSIRHVNQEMKPFWVGLSVTLFKIMLFLFGVLISFGIALLIHQVIEFLFKKSYQLSIVRNGFKSFPCINFCAC